MAVVLKHPPSHMTLAEFVSWDSGDRSGRRWQLLDGEPVAMAPASQPHGALQSELAALIRNHLLEKASPCRIITEPGIVPRVRANENFRIPDLGVTCSADTSGIMVPDPVVSIEILSPNNEVETRTNVWAYTTIPSVQEILVVHSTRVEAELLRRREDGSWPDSPEIIRMPGSIELISISFSVPLLTLYRTTPLAG